MDFSKQTIIWVMPNAFENALHFSWIFGISDAHHCWIFATPDEIDFMKPDLNRWNHSHESFALKLFWPGASDVGRKSIHRLLNKKDKKPVKLAAKKGKNNTSQVGEPIEYEALEGNTETITEESVEHAQDEPLSFLEFQGLLHPHVLLNIFRDSSHKLTRSRKKGSKTLDAIA